MQEQRVAFGPFVFDRTSNTLWQGAALVSLGGRATALLAALLNTDGVATRDALLDAVWPGAIVEDGNLAVQVATLRKALGTRPDGREWIATVPRVGYRLLRDAADDPGPSRGATIAVLPFLNLSGDPAQEHFADGMVEDLITALSRFRSFAVIARTSSFIYKGRAVDIREAARTLGVRYLLEGSVRRSGRRVRVSAQLIDGATAAHLWADNFDGTLDDMLDFQDHITSAVIALIEPRIRYAEIERARRKRPENLDAYDLYLRALPLMQGTAVIQYSDYGEIIALLERAIALDPGFAPALALCAWAHEKRVTRGGSPPGARDAEAAIDLAQRALLADPADANVLLVAGVVRLTLKHDTQGGIALIIQAAALNPNSLIIANTANYARFHGGDFASAIDGAQRALRLSPASPQIVWTLMSLARYHLSAGHFEESLLWSMRAMEASTAHDLAHGVLAAAYAHLGRLEEARAVVASALALWPGRTISGILGTDEATYPHDRNLAQGLTLAGMPPGDLKNF